LNARTPRWACASRHLASPLQQAAEQRARRCRVSAVSELHRVDDRVVAIGVAVSREDLLELELHARAAGDHLRDRGGDRVLGLAPVLRGGIPDTTLVELERAARQDDRRCRVDHAPRIAPLVRVHLFRQHAINLLDRFTAAGPPTSTRVDVVDARWKPSTRPIADLASANTP
jgi:hypothetical protein